MAHGLYHYVSRLSPGWLVVIFTVVNILNYLDRGIVPGAFESLGGFVQAEFAVNNTDTYTGVLQSSFIGGYSVASLTFGHLVHVYPPFKLVAIGLSIWCAAVVLSGIAPNFYILVLGRVLSGVGEASFQCVVPPYIDDNAPPDKRAIWLSAFYMAIPVGTAFGYGYGGAVGSSSLGWRGAFIMEAFPMVPLIILIWFLPFTRHRREALAKIEAELETDVSAAVHTPATEARAHSLTASSVSMSTPPKGVQTSVLGYGTSHPDSAPKRVASTSLLSALNSVATTRKSGGSGDIATGGSDYAALTDNAPLLAHARSPHGSFNEATGTRATVPAHMPHHLPPTTREVERETVAMLAAAGDTRAAADTTTPADAKPTFWQELLITLANPVYMSVVLGYAGFTAVVAGLGTFAPTFVLDLDLVSTQTIAALSAGACVAVAGAIGTPAGGWLVDWGTRRLKAQVDARRQAKRPPSVVIVSRSPRMPSGSSRTLGDQLSLQSEGGAKGRSEGAAPLIAFGPEATQGAAPTAAGDVTVVDDEDDATSPDELDVKLVVSMQQSVILSIVGSMLTVGSIYITAATTNLFPFLLVLGAGTVLLMGTTAGINLAMMASVPAESRSFAIGMGTLLLHALGDVPAPPIIGFLADDLSPKYNCVGTTCDRSASGLRLTLALASGWLVWPILCWGFAYIYTHRRLNERIESGYYDKHLIQETAKRTSARLASASTRQVNITRRGGDEDERTTTLLDDDEHARGGTPVATDAKASSMYTPPPTSAELLGIPVAPPTNGRRPFAVALHPSDGRIDVDSVRSVELRPASVSVLRGSGPVI